MLTNFNDDKKINKVTKAKSAKNAIVDVIESYSSKDSISSKDTIPENLKLQPLDFIMEFPKIIPYNAIPISPLPITNVNPPSY